MFGCQTPVGPCDWPLLFGCQTPAGPCRVRTGRRAKCKDSPLTTVLAPRATRAACVRPRMVSLLKPPLLLLTFLCDILCCSALRHADTRMFKLQRFSSKTHGLNFALSQTLAPHQGTIFPKTSGTPLLSLFLQNIELSASAPRHSTHLADSVWQVCKLSLSDVISC